MRRKKINWTLTAGAFVMLTMSMGAMARNGGGRMNEMRAKSMNCMPVMERSMAMQKDTLDVQMKEMHGEM
jgi:hypothetical protein